jgi:hypothetical protein
MRENDLQARPIYHHLRDSIEAHLTVVFAALAEARFLNTSRALAHLAGGRADQTWDKRLRERAAAGE